MHCIVCIAHTICQRFFLGEDHTFKYNVVAMRKDTALSFRIPGHLKTELEKVALSEGRSLAQVCEALLAGGSRSTRRRVRNIFSAFSPARRKCTSSDSGSAGSPSIPRLRYMPRELAGARLIQFRY